MTVPDRAALPAPTHSAELESRLAAVESRLAALGNALRARDAAGIELNANELHRALAAAVSHFSAAAKNGPLPSALRDRFVKASGQVAAQRETLARATAALDRAIDVLLPREGAALYSVYGTADRGVFKSGVFRA